MPRPRRGHAELLGLDTKDRTEKFDRQRAELLRGLASANAWCAFTASVMHLLKREEDLLFDESLPEDQRRPLVAQVRGELASRERETFPAIFREAMRGALSRDGIDPDTVPEPYFAAPKAGVARHTPAAVTSGG